MTEDKTKIEFKYKNKVLCSYIGLQTAEELRETLKLLSMERNINPDDISIFIDDIEIKKAKVDFLVKVIKYEGIDEETGDHIINVLNESVYNLLIQPMRINGEPIEKDVLCCDGCNAVCPEYVLTDGEYLHRCICKKCKYQYYKDYAVKDLRITYGVKTFRGIFIS